jgi:subtilisin family serine protease
VGRDPTALDDAVQSVIDAGITVVVAAGNGAINADLVTPAHVSEALTVGSHARNKKFSKFSNFGASLDLLAPGEKILSLAPGFGFSELSGTSMSAAHVTGAAALYLGQYPMATPSEVGSYLIQMSSSQRAIKKVPSRTAKTMVWVGNMSLASSDG